MWSVMAAERCDAVTSTDCKQQLRRESDGNAPYVKARIRGKTEENGLQTFSRISLKKYDRQPVKSVFMEALKLNDF